MSRLNRGYLPPAFFSAGGPWVRPAPGIPRALCLREGILQQGSDAAIAPRDRVRLSCRRLELQGACGDNEDRRVLPQVQPAYQGSPAVAARRSLVFRKWSHRNVDAKCGLV